MVAAVLTACSGGGGAQLADAGSRAPSDGSMSAPDGSENFTSNDGRAQLDGGGAQLDGAQLDGAQADAGADMEPTPISTDAGSGDAGCYADAGRVCSDETMRCGTCDNDGNADPFGSSSDVRALYDCAGACVLECEPTVIGWGEWNGTCYE